MKNPDKYTGKSRKILELIYTKKQITRRNLAEILGCSSLTVLNLVKTMLDDGIIIEIDQEMSKMGRKPQLLGINPDYAYVIGIDIGCYSTKIGIINFRGDLIYKEIHSSSNSTAPSSNLDFQKLQAHVEKLIDKYGKDCFLGIGIGITGLVDYKAQTIVYCPNILGYNNLAISKILEERFGLPTVVDTSVRCMALGERYFGDQDYNGNLAFISIGYSIAAGLIIENEIFRGSTGFAGELGHVKAVRDSDQLCTCGSYGCIELYATSPMLKISIIKKLESFRGYSLLKERFDQTKDISYKEIAKAALAGDKIVRETFAEVIVLLGKVLADFINLFNPILLVMGGGFFDIFPFILSPLEQEIKKWCLTPSQHKIQMRCSALSMEGAIIGSAMQITERYFREKHVVHN
jgi:predicted NBD/HSP70 family sugar kinase